MPTRGTEHRTFRGLDQADWDAFGAATARQGADRSAVLRAFIRHYIHRPGAKLPKRPPA